MYVVIVCEHCGRSSQVESGSLGKRVECPSCGKPTLARTSEAVLPVAKPVEKTAAEEAPLSLDDAAAPAPEAKAAKRSPVRTALYASISLFLTLLLMGSIYGGFRYGSGDIPARAWKKFVPPDGKCTIDLPGDPEVEEIPAEGFANLGGKRFVVNRWFERVQVTFGWIDLDADKLAGVKFDQIYMPFRNSETKRLNGKIAVESSVNFVVGKRKFESSLIQMNTDRGKALLQIYFDTDPERLRYRIEVGKELQPFPLFVPSGWGAGGVWIPVELSVEVRKRVIDAGEHLRLYFASVQGKKIGAEMPWVPKFFNSFVPE